MKFSIFDSGVGQLLRVGECPDEEVELQVQPGELLIPDFEAGWDQYLDLATSEVVTRPPKPTEDHAWDDAARAWVVDLEPVRSRVLKALKRERDRRLNDTFIWNGHTFDADQVSQTRILGAVVSASGSPELFPVGWRLADNSWVTLSAQDVAAVWGALQAHIQAHFAAFSTKEAQVNALTTVEQLQAYQTDTGWPSS